MRSRAARFRAATGQDEFPNCSTSSVCPDWLTGRRGACPAVSSSGWRWRARWHAIRRCCFSIEDLVRAIAARNIKVVMSTHDLGQARRLAGDIVFMHRGRVAEVGAAAEFFANPRTEEARRFIAGELLL